MRVVLFTTYLAGLLAISGAHAGTVINFLDNGDYLAPYSVSEGGVTVVGYWWLKISPNGISVTGGGGSDDWVDPNWDRNEYVDFIADGETLFGSFYFGGIVRNLDGGAIDSFLIEGFDLFGNRVGSYSTVGLGVQEIFATDFFSLLGSPVHDLRLSSAGDAYRLWNITVDFMPEPGTMALLGPGLACLGLSRRRKAS